MRVFSSKTSVLMQLWYCFYVLALILARFAKGSSDSVLAADAAKPERHSQG